MVPFHIICCRCFDVFLSSDELKEIKLNQKVKRIHPYNKTAGNLFLSVLFITGVFPNLQHFDFQY